MRAICKISYFYKIAYCALAPTSYDSLLDTPIFRGLNAFSGFFAHAIINCGWYGGAAYPFRFHEGVKVVLGLTESVCGGGFS